MCFRKPTCDNIAAAVGCAVAPVDHVSVCVSLPKSNTFADSVTGEPSTPSTLSTTSVGAAFSTETIVLFAVRTNGVFSSVSVTVSETV